MRWLYSYLLFFLLLIPFLLIWQHWYRYKNHPQALPFSSLDMVQKEKLGIWIGLLRIQRYAYIPILILVVLSMARPQRLMTRWPIWDKGIDIAFVLDLSTSMRARDIRPNRMATAKGLILSLISMRRQKDDRFALVVFSKQAYTLCPLTYDLAMLRKMLGSLEAGQIGNDTAIGDAIATGLARLRHAPHRQRAILLITDGENNAGNLHPFRAARCAKQMGIPIYPILIGRSSGKKEFLQKEIVSKVNSLGWHTLQRVATRSGGYAFRITNFRDLSRHLPRILNKMTPQRNKKPRYFSKYIDIFELFLLPALILLGLSLFLQFTRLRTIG